jgi:hypothetical protein
MTTRDERFKINEGLQQVILDVLKQSPPSSEDACALLRAEIDRRGLPCQPPDWLQAAGDEIAHGNVYVVSKKAAPQGYRQ